MSRRYPGLYRLMVKYVWSDGTPGFDYTHTPDAYEECQKLAILLGAGAPWQVVDPKTGKPENVRVTGSIIVGPVADAEEVVGTA